MSDRHLRNRGQRPNVSFSLDGDETNQDDASSMTPGATVAPKPPTLSPITVIADRTEDGGVEFKGGERENSDYDPAIRAIKGLTVADESVWIHYAYEMLPSH